MTPREILLTVLSEQDAHDVLEHRRVTIKKPLTARSAKMLVDEFVKFGDPARAVEIMISRAWRGFDHTWVNERPRPGSGMMGALNRVMQ